MFCMFYQYISTAIIASKMQADGAVMISTTETIYGDYHVVKFVYVFSKFPPKKPFAVKWGVHHQSPPRRIVIGKTHACAGRPTLFYVNNLCMSVFIGGN